ncbi:MAG: 4-hydroxy-3-methylbut-2-enyl diphosphate reductase [Thermodesulfobacteriota bacterium]|nr:4-hydroxy-3-methylbut-2-enyl diphosphate reductase [Thermodesulfobacteriota bacterium]
MKVSIAKTSGFCMGVRRAVDMVLDAANTHDQPIQTFGPLIHNPQVLALLAEKNITAIDAIPRQGDGIMLIRAHGVPPDTLAALEAAGYTVVDATCPRVIKVQTIIQQHARQGYAVIIVGDSDHPEVIGLQGYAGGNGHVIQDMNALSRLPVFDKAIIVAQTTQSTALFDEITQWAEINRPEYKVFNTICPSTRNRQAETERLARSVDAMIVVGGYNSGNTQRLAQICQDTGKPVQHVETSADLSTTGLTNARHIGITAGASTPNWIIKKIYRELEAAYYKSKGAPLRGFFRLQRLLMLTNIYLAIGAGCLSWGATNMRHAHLFLPHTLIAVLYIFSMHTLNRLTGIEEDHYNDPYRAAFYENNMFLLAVLAIVAGGAGLLVAFALGVFPFLLLLGMSALGLSYNLYLVPTSADRFKIKRIKDIPGSKTLLISAAWGVTVAAFPAAAAGTFDVAAVFTAVWCAGLVFVRSAFFDIMDMQGDRIAGKETIPILLGADRAMRLLIYILAVLFFVLPIAAFLGIIDTVGYMMMIVPAYDYLLLRLYKQDALYSGATLEFLLESQFYLAGIIAVIWALL